MRKALLSVTAIALAFAISGCGKVKLVVEDDSSKTSASSSFVASENSDSDSETSSSSDLESSISSDLTDSSEIDSDDDSDDSWGTDADYGTATIEKTVLYNKHDVKITANVLEFDYGTPELNITITNKSKKDLTFLGGATGYSCNAINNFMVNDGYVDETVAAGKSSKVKVSFSTDDLKQLGIDKIESIQIGLQAEDDDYNTVFETGGMEVKTSDYENGGDPDCFKKAIDNGDFAKEIDGTVDYYATDKLYDGKGVSIVSEALATDENGDKYLLCEFENSSEKEVIVQSNDIEINGLLVAGGEWSRNRISAGKRMVMSLSLSDLASYSGPGLKNLGIDEIGTVSYALKVYDKTFEKVIDKSNITVNTGKNSDIASEGEKVYDKKGISITALKLLDDESEDAYIVLFITNKTGSTLTISGNDDLSVGDTMVDSSSGYCTLKNKKTGLYTISIDSNALSENDISSIDDLKNIEYSLKIYDKNYNEIKAKLKIN